ncbi:MAG TPA: glycosyltransferase family 2 protein [Acidobacteriota bacterium]|nr:glycosyltransferase family 2 protein [Acidobacteriota bacterium]
MGKIQLSVVAPVYNEAEGIEPVVRYWKSVLDSTQIPAEIVLANDGSTDDTLRIVQEMQKEIPYLRVVSYPENRGYGYALRTAIQASGGDVVVSLDSDGQFDLADFSKLLKLYRDQDLDFVTGYRDRKKDTLLRVVADRGLNFIVRVMFGVKLRDTNCALKLMKGSLIRSLNLEATGYPTPTEITVKLVKLGARTGEAAVQHRERQAGQSKLQFAKTSISMFRFLLYLRKRIKLYEARIVHTL